ncbi:alpha/beta fold hydrolase [Nannocystaceae bacterium ST9]
MTTLESRTFTTDRLVTHAWVAGSPEHPPVLLIHGNVSSAVFFDRLQAELAGSHYVIAPDLRGYGGSQAKPVDATRGVRDYADDLAGLLAHEALALRGRPLDVVGWSAGANVAMQLAIDHGRHVNSLVLINPGSPYGFGGTKGLAGTPCFADFAGSGGGTANPQFVELLRSKDASGDQPSSPRNVMNAFYWKPPFRPAAEHEDRYVEAMLATVVDPGNYPGDMQASSNWPGVAPGRTGMNNALSPKYLDQAGFATIDRKPPVLWVRGADDQIVSDRSMFDFGLLGELGVVPGWPGAEVYPAQPMVGQTRAVLDRYAAGGGRYDERVFADCGHGPHVEKHDEFVRALGEFWGRIRG